MAHCTNLEEVHSIERNEKAGKWARRPVCGFPIASMSWSLTWEARQKRERGKKDTEQNGYGDISE